MRDGQLERRAEVSEEHLRDLRARYDGAIAYTDHILGDFVDCVKTRAKPFRDIEIAHRTATLAHLGNIAYWLERPLRWNPETEERIGDADASKWLDRDMRAPWKLV